MPFPSFPRLPGIGALAPWQTQKAPNVTDFYTFLTTVAGIPEAALPPNSGYIPWALSYSEEMTLLVLNAMGQDYYCFAVYCLGTSFLINWCPDQPDMTYFADLRQQWNLTGFVGGTVASSADVATSESLNVPEFLNTLTMANLNMVLDPWGRQWMAMNQENGAIWGIS